MENMASVFDTSHLWCSHGFKTDQHNQKSIKYITRHRMVCLNIDTEMSPIHSLIITGVKRCKIWRLIGLVSKGNNRKPKKNSLRVFEGPMSPPNLVRFCPRTPVNYSIHKTAPLKIVRRQRAKSAITRPRVVQCRSNCVQSLVTWHPIYCKRSRSSVKGQGHSVKTSSDRQNIALF